MAIGTRDRAQRQTIGRPGMPGAIRCDNQLEYLGAAVLTEARRYGIRFGRFDLCATSRPPVSSDPTRPFDTNGYRNITLGGVQHFTADRLGPCDHDRPNLAFGGLALTPGLAKEASFLFPNLAEARGITARALSADTAKDHDALCLQ
jgi:hypothetical protein